MKKGKNKIEFSQLLRHNDQIMLKNSKKVKVKVKEHKFQHKFQN